MHPLLPLLLLFSLSAVPVSARAPASLAGTGGDPVAKALRDRLETLRWDDPAEVAGRELGSLDAVDRYYRERRYRPAWTERGRPLPRADVLLIALETSRLEGLRPSHYHAEEVSTLAARLRRGEPVRPTGWEEESSTDAEAAAALELLLTDAFLLYAADLSTGRAEAREVDPEWKTALRGADVEAALRRAVLDDRPAAVLRSLRPPAPEYARLRDVLARLRGLAAAGGWSAVPEGPTLRVGDRDARVPALRARLAAEVGLSNGAPDPGTDHDEPDRFDEDLEAAVRDFQERHGLAADGVVGERTVAELNVPVTDRIARVRVNLERWRWLSEHLGERHVRVNVAAFRMEVIEHGRTVRVHRAVVGKEYRETPIFSDRIRHVVFAPVWNVPRSIAGADKLPKIRNDPGYLAAQNMWLVDARTGRRVDPATVDFSAMSSAAFTSRFYLIQRPGPLNALGDVKFSFPNRYKVYLHDTSEPWLFDQAQRVFSSGCIRIDDPFELATYLLGPEWTEERMRGLVATGREQSVDLPEPFPIHILYFTVFVDDEGRVFSVPDVYGRDAAVLHALDAPR